MALLAPGPWEQGPPSLVGVWPPVAKGVVLLSHLLPIRRRSCPAQVHTTYSTASSGLAHDLATLLQLAHFRI